MNHSFISSSDISFWLQLAQLKVILAYSFNGEMSYMSLMEGLELLESLELSLFLPESFEVSLILSSVPANFLWLGSIDSLNWERFLKVTGDFSYSLSDESDSMSLESVLAKLNLASCSENLSMEKSLP